MSSDYVGIILRGMIPCRSKKDVARAAKMEHSVAIARWCLYSACIVLFAGHCRAQTAHTSTAASKVQASFDVISIRPSDPKNLGFSIRPKADNFEMTGGTVEFLIEYAYRLHGFQVEGPPAWLTSARYDVAAKMDDLSDGQRAGVDQSKESDIQQETIEARLQSLLAERFHLVVHMRTKEMPILALVVKRGGPKLRPAAENSGYTSTAGRFVFSDISMDGLASLLSEELNHIVVNRTNLAGGYAFTLKWAPEGSPNEESTSPGISTALEEQLGLKLVTTKGDVGVLRVDHVDRPSEN